jgi:hypothetical protein
MRLRKDAKWAPAFSILLQDSAVAGKTKVVGLQISTRNSKPPLELRVIQSDGPDVVTDENSNTRLGLNAVIPVEIVWMPHHLVVIRIGENEVHHLKVSWQIERISITASTGQMKIDPLVLGCIDKAPQ